jgi:hypothetical protein
MSQTDDSTDICETQFEYHPKVNLKKEDLPCPRALEYKNSDCVSFTVRAVAVFMSLGGFKWHLVFLRHII